MNKNQNLVKFNLTVPKHKPEKNKPYPLIVIKEGDLEFTTALFKWASVWTKENGFENPTVCNTIEGYYQIQAIKK